MLVGRFQARGGIDWIAQRPVVEHGLATEVADDHLARMNPDARGAEGNALFFQAPCVIAGEYLHLLRAGQRPGAVVSLSQRGGKHDRHGIADNPVERALVTEGDGDHPVEVIVEQRDSAFRVDALHQRGETGQVGEDETAGPPLSAERHVFLMLDQVSHAVGRHVTGKGRPDPALVAFGDEMVGQAAEGERPQDTEQRQGRVDQQAAAGERQPGAGEHGKHQQQASAGCHHGARAQRQETGQQATGEQRGKFDSLSPGRAFKVMPAQDLLQRFGMDFDPGNQAERTETQVHQALRGAAHQHDMAGQRSQCGIILEDPPGRQGASLLVAAVMHPDFTLRRRRDAQLADPDFPQAGVVAIAGHLLQMAGAAQEDYRRRLGYPQAFADQRR